MSEYQFHRPALRCFWSIPYNDFPVGWRKIWPMVKGVADDVDCSITCAQS